jgi:hypothetical protein
VFAPGVSVRSILECINLVYTGFCFLFLDGVISKNTIIRTSEKCWTGAISKNTIIRTSEK